MDLCPNQRQDLLALWKARFEKNPHRHAGLHWDAIQTRLEANPQKLWSLQEMERTGGEPDVVGYDQKTGEYIFFDCSSETPSGRTSMCYDREAWDSRKDNKPKNNAIDLAEAMGVELLTEDQYHQLQQLDEFDTKTSSWLKTPEEIRKLGGALFGERRFGRCFVYHNGAQSYFSARGFRSSIWV